MKYRINQLIKTADETHVLIEKFPLTNSYRYFPLESFSHQYFYYYINKDQEGPFTIKYYKSDNLVFIRDNIDRGKPYREILGRGQFQFTSLNYRFALFQSILPRNAACLILSQYHVRQLGPPSPISDQPTNILLSPKFSRSSHEVLT